MEEISLTSLAVFALIFIFSGLVHGAMGLGFPVLAIEDIAAAGYEVVKSLGLLRLHSVIGASMGGMSALAFCAL